MNNQLYEAELETIREMARAITSARETVSLLEEARATLLRRYEALGVPRPRMTEASGMTRGRMWQIVQPDPPVEVRRYVTALSDEREEILDNALELRDSDAEAHPLGFYIAKVMESARVA